MSKTFQMGVIGCGDFLRVEMGRIKAGGRVRVAALYDPDRTRSSRYADEFSAAAVNTAEDILNDPSIDIVCLFVPPWARRDLLIAAAKAGKHILTTKPLAVTPADCRAMHEAVEANNVRCGVIYMRTGHAVIEALKTLFESGEIGSLALYKQDWIHHYPEWNQWALDPKKNGGPFMDAMIHNMNAARYLMGRNATACTFFSDSHAHQLPCGDTEFMKLDFERAGSAHLFITWAADLAVQSKEGNYREHIDLFYMVTDAGWRVTCEGRNGNTVIVASREGVTREWPVAGPARTHYDTFADSIERNAPLARDLPGIQEASEDIDILAKAAGALGRTISLPYAA